MYNFLNLFILKLRRYGMRFNVKALPFNMFCNLFVTGIHKWISSTKLIITNALVTGLQFNCIIISGRQKWLEWVQLNVKILGLRKRRKKLVSGCTTCDMWKCNLVSNTGEISLENAVIVRPKSNPIVLLYE